MVNYVVCLTLFPNLKVLVLAEILDLPCPNIFKRIENVVREWFRTTTIVNMVRDLGVYSWLYGRQAIPHKLLGVHCLRVGLHFTLTAYHLFLQLKTHHVTNRAETHQHIRKGKAWRSISPRPKLGYLYSGGHQFLQHGVGLPGRSADIQSTIVLERYEIYIGYMNRKKCFQRQCQADNMLTK